jgi:predicted DNA-binding transcriptional regulator AlpA
MSGIEPNLLNMADVSQRLGCSKMHVYRLVQAGALVPVNISVPGTKRSRLRFTETSLSDYIRRSEYLPERS